jgi:N utilization substance protein A
MSNQPAARTDFSAAIAQIASERKISPEAIVNAIKAALVSAYRKQDPELDESLHYFATVDEISGESRIFSAPILEQDEETLQVLAWDEKKAVDVTPAGFGRIAAQTAKQVILQKIRESEKEQILGDFQDKIGEIVTGTVLRMDGRMVVVDVGRGQAYMPPEEQMRGEFYRMNMRITVLIKDIRDMYRGRTIVVSRADKNLVAKLFEREVPEVASGAVEIAMIAREAGVRTKLAVKAGQDGVDPVGSCVGQRGVRVQEVIKELNNEKIDIIPYTESITTLLQGALAPAESLLIKVDEANKMAVVTAPDEQLSLAIGKGGQNVRLAAKLTGYRITIQSAGGDVKTAVTGQEEHEIDTIEGIDEETRNMLIMFKLTTVNDLVRFKDKWQSFDKVSDEQKALLQAAVEVREAEDIKEAEAYHARHAAKQVAEETPVTTES